MQAFVASGGNLNRADANGTTLKNYYQRFAQGGAPVLQKTFGSVHGPGGPPSDLPAVQPGGNVSTAWVDPNAPLPVPPVPPADGGPPPFNPNAGPRVAGAPPALPGAIVPPVTGSDPNAPVQIPPARPGAFRADPPSTGRFSGRRAGCPFTDRAADGRDGCRRTRRGTGRHVAGGRRAESDVSDGDSRHHDRRAALQHARPTSSGRSGRHHGAASQAQAQAAPPAAQRPTLPQPSPPPSRAIQTEPLIQGGPFDGLTQGQAQAARAAGASLVPTATLAAQMQTWRQQNIANRQTAATAAAAQQQAEIARQQWLYEQQVKAGWEDAGNGVIRNRYTGETKYAGPPTPRIGTDESGRQFEVLPGGGMRYLTDNPVRRHGQRATTPARCGS